MLKKKKKVLFIVCSFISSFWLIIICSFSLKKEHRSDIPHWETKRKTRNMSFFSSLLFSVLLLFLFVDYFVLSIFFFLPSFFVDSMIFYLYLIKNKIVFQLKINFSFSFHLSLFSISIFILLFILLYLVLFYFLLTTFEASFF